MEICQRRKLDRDLADSQAVTRIHCDWTTWVLKAHEPKQKSEKFWNCNRMNQALTAF